MPDRKRKSTNKRATKAPGKITGKRSSSSHNWLKRQARDPYTTMAKDGKWRSRAAFKLLEIDERYHLLSPGKRIIDLGAAPGGWAQVAALRCNSHAKSPLITAVDINSMAKIDGVRFIQGDFTDDALINELVQSTTVKADLIISDMAPATTGHKQTDHWQIIDLAEQALQFSHKVLDNGGALLCKIFRGGMEDDLCNTMRQNFASVKYVKPSASRKDSTEIYILAQNYNKS